MHKRQHIQHKHTHTFRFTLRLNFLRRWTDILSNRDLRSIFSSAQKGNKRKKNPLQTTIQLFQIDINGLSKHSVNKKLTLWNTVWTKMCHMIVCVHAMKSMSEVTVISQHGLSPPFLHYSVCHVVSRLLMDSQWSSTCNSQLNDCCNTGVIQPTYTADSLWKPSHRCSLIASSVSVYKQLGVSYSEEIMGLQETINKAIMRKLNVMRSYVLQL